jgi:hypothetical protein
MPPSTNRRCLVRAIGVFAIALVAPSAQAEGTQDYGFTAAAQEVSQLFWLADTANVCGWASKEETLKFKRFSLRFLAAHLSESNTRALVSLIGTKDYERAVRRAAEEGSEQSCDAARWRDGWSAYKAVADEQEREF